MIGKGVIDEVPGLYRVMPLKVFRKTPGVVFDFVPLHLVPGVQAVDRVIHGPDAISPGPVDSVERPWYMHPNQQDHLVLLSGTRIIELYRPRHGKIETFTVSTHRIEKNGQLLHDGACVLSWYRGVFHRVRSLGEGSSVINLATHFSGFDLRTNFSVYDVDLETGKFKMIRVGYMDQFEIEDI